MVGPLDSIQIVAFGPRELQPELDPSAPPQLYFCISRPLTVRCWNGSSWTEIEVATTTAIN